MSKKRTIENRIEAYRMAHQADKELDALLSDCEAEIYKLRRDLKLREHRATQPTLKGAGVGGA